MRLGKSAATAAGVMLVITLGGCHSGGRTVSAGKPAGAADAPPPQVACADGESPFHSESTIAPGFKGYPTPLEAATAEVDFNNARKPAGQPHISHDRFSNQPGSDTVHGPAAVVRRYGDGRVGAVLTATRLPSGGWVITSENACASFWRGEGQ